jgi:ribose transport system substrate-binding protein
MRLRIDKRVALAALAAITLSACSTGVSSTGASQTGAQSHSGPIRIAFLMGAGSTTGNSANRDGAKAAAAKLGVELSVLDAAFSPQKQYAQFQDAITSKKYQGIVIDGALDGAAIASLVPSAQAAGIKIGAANLPIGTDYTTDSIQTKGVDVQVLVPFGRHGTLAGRLTEMACEGIDSCGVGYMFINKGSPYDTAIRTAYDAVIGKDPNIEVVGEANSMTSAQGGANAAQTMTTGNKGIDVLVGPDVSLLAAIPVLEAAHLDHPVKLIAFGGVELAAKAVKDGQFFGITANPTYDEGRLVIEKLHQVITEGGGPIAINPVDAIGIPDGGMLTKQNIDGWKISGS